MVPTYAMHLLPGRWQQNRMEGGELGMGILEATIARLCAIVNAIVFTKMYQHVLQYPWICQCTAPVGKPWQGPSALAEGMGQ